MTDFLTIPEEIEYVAQAALKHYSDMGFKNKIEPKELEYPERPAFSAKLNGETTIVLVCSSLSSAQIDTWVRFGTSMTSPTLIAVACVSKNLSGASLEHAAKCGVGVLSVSDDLAVTSIGNTKDQTFKISLPDLASERKLLKSALAPSYQKFDAGDWRGGFQDATIALEQRARTYFRVAVRSGRLRTQRQNGTPNTPTEGEIDSFTIGQLHSRFSNSIALNQDDSRVIDTLKRINASRISLVHHKYKRETALRKKIGPDMYAIVNCLRIL